MFTNSTKEPKQGGSADLVLKPRDMEILSAVHQHRFLTTDLIWRLLRDGGPGSPDYGIGKDGVKRPKSYGFGLKALYKRLSLLHREGFLARHYVTDQPYGASHGSPRAVYGLGPHAALPIAQLSGVSQFHVRRMVEANEVKSPYLRHALEISTFRVTLTLACRLTKGRVKLANWDQRERLGNNRFSVYPDAVFGLSTDARPTLNYALEIDRGTMPIIASGPRSDLKKKFLRYKQFSDHIRRSRKTRSERGDRVFDPPPSSFHGFRALFVVPGTFNSHASPNGRLGNILSALPTFGREFATASLFWFTTRDSYSVKNPASILTRIWKTSNPTKPPQSLVGDSQTSSNRPA